MILKQLMICKKIKLDIISHPMQKYIPENAVIFFYM